MSYHVLVVDDEKNIRRTLEMVLTGEGYRVTAVATAEEGLELLEREEIDLAILDVKLPGISGIDALKRIRERRQGEGRGDRLSTDDELAHRDLFFHPRRH